MKYASGSVGIYALSGTGCGAAPRGSEPRPSASGVAGGPRAAFLRARFGLGEPSRSEPRPVESVCWLPRAEKSRPNVLFTRSPPRRCGFRRRLGRRARRRAGRFGGRWCRSGAESPSWMPARLLLPHDSHRRKSSRAPPAKRRKVFISSDSNTRS